jgi:hypothetical protein
MLDAENERNRQKEEITFDVLVSLSSSQSPLHVRALATVDLISTKIPEKQDQGIESSADLGSKALYASTSRVIERYRRVEETRWSNLLQSSLCLLLSLFLRPVLRLIPSCVLSGILLYMGVSCVQGSELLDRTLCLFMEESRRPDFRWTRGKPPWRLVKIYTIVQLLCTAVIFSISSNLFLGRSGPPISVFFPLFVAILVPIREKLLSRYFSAEELYILDSTIRRSEEEHYMDCTAWDRTNSSILVRPASLSF